ncbi:MAG: hypothetical protein H0W72_06910 [Planctomycetes bacterium]|nr:hypothetical protein [Planctomycetota bacterium]
MLRDPISRFVSGFLHDERQGYPRWPKSWSPAERLAFERFASPDDLARSLSSTDTTRRQHAVEAMNELSHVRERMVDWFVSLDYARERLADIWFIAFQESLAADFERLRGLLQLPEAVSLPGDEVRSNRAPRNDGALHEDAIANLKRWFSADYALIALLADRQQAGPEPR